MMGLDGSPPEFESLVHVLRHRAGEAPDLPLFSYLADSESGEAVGLTRSELDLRVRALAVRLQDAGLEGSSALLLYPPGLEFVVAFFGCLYAGVIAVPAHLPRPNHPMNRLRAIVTDAGPRAVLTCQSQRQHAGRWAAGVGELSGVPVFFTDEDLEAVAT